MAIVEWKADYSVGNPHVDLQHRRLFDLINLLHDAMVARKTDLVLGDILQQLADYTAYHFGQEEQLMAGGGYPGLRVHAAAHAEFVERIGTFQTEHAAGRILISLEVARFLKEWLVEHVLTMDQQLAPWITAS